QGRCDLAVADYTAVARSNGPAAERARALVGLGLCREAAGDEAGAERYFEEARRLDPGAEAWLRSESASKPSKKSRKAVAEKP
ncbi:MAG TPA: tetratricopeptide repeat protein, partial [Nannocystis sp.]